MIKIKRIEKYKLIFVKRKKTTYAWKYLTEKYGYSEYDAFEAQTTDGVVIYIPKLKTNFALIHFELLNQKSFNSP